MAKKADLLAQANELKLNVTEKNTIAEIESAIAGSKSSPKVSEESEATAKAGKRSAKALKEAEQKAEKEVKKASGDTSSTKDVDDSARQKKGPAPKTRPLIERRSKKYQKAAELIDKDTLYSLEQAMELVEKTSTTSFDASVEMHVRLGVDPRQADQNIRATVVLPNGTGKAVRVAVFAPADQHEAAKKAGADLVGDDDLLQLLEKEQIDFDVLVATPQYMPKLGKYARTLGPRGLMPNPKSGTVAADVSKAVKEAKTGKVEYRVDKQSIIHLGVGKVSFGGSKLHQNAKSFFESLEGVRPSSLKTSYIVSIHATTTMGPSVKIDPTKTT